VTKHSQNNPFEKYPVLLLAAGPSLEKNIEWVKQNKNNFIIVALTATLKLLQKHNIAPDIITHVDGYQTSLIHLEGIDTKNFLANTLCIFQSLTPLELREMFPSEHIFTTDGFSYYYHNLPNILIACVGSFSFNILLHLQTTQLYTLGLDLALDSKTGATHSSSHASASIIDTTDTDKIDTEINFKKNIISIEGNFQKEMKTLPHFKLSVDNINSTIKNIKKDSQQIFNLSDGAKFLNSTPLKVEEIKLQKNNINKLGVKDELITYLANASRTTLTKEEKESFHTRLTQQYELKSIIENFTNKKYTNADTFIYDFATLYMDILGGISFENTTITYVYRSYLQYVFPIVYDFFNTKDLKHKKRDLKKIKPMIDKELLDIVQTYIDALEEFIKTRHI
jgi:hypothetical protein